MLQVPPVFAPHRRKLVVPLVVPDHILAPVTVLPLPPVVVLAQQIEFLLMLHQLPLFALLVQRLGSVVSGTGFLFRQ